MVDGCRQKGHRLDFVLMKFVPAETVEPVDSSTFYLLGL